MLHTSKKSNKTQMATPRKPSDYFVGASRRRHCYDVRQNNQMHKIILLLLLCIGIFSCGTTPSDFRPVWIHPGTPPDQPPKHLPSPIGFGITPSQAYRIAWNSRRLSLKHQWSLYADSNYYYVHDTFLGDSTNRAFRQGLRINGRSGDIELRAESGPGE